jgi:hypothetical protein
MFRLKTSFSHRKDDLLSRIRTGNVDLYQFLEKEALLQQHSRSSTPAPAKSHAQVVKSLLKFQKQASYAFKGFQHRWICSCSCAGAHRCGISSHGSDLKLLFDNGTERKHVKVEVKVTETPDSSDCSTAPPTARKQEDVTVLRHQVSIRNRFKKLSKGAPKSILKLTTSTLSTFPKPVNMEVNDDHNSLESSLEQLQKRYVLFLLEYESSMEQKIRTHTRKAGIFGFITQHDSDANLIHHKTQIRRQYTWSTSLERLTSTIQPTCGAR